MKFKIRFADQIVGFFIVLSLVSLIVVIVFLGRSQRWFAKDISYVTILPSAGGLSKNMAVQYRGFSIGNIKTFSLNDSDDVEVVFTINEEYRNRVKRGSLVEMMISPVGLGNQFLFHSGRGDVLPEGTLVPAVGSAQARELIRQGLAVEPRHDDSISLLMNRASSILEELNRLVVQVNVAFGEGTDETEIGKIAGSIQKTLAGVEVLPQTLDSGVNTVVQIIEEIQTDLKPILVSIDSILANVTDITEDLTNPDGFLFSILDTDKEVYINLIESIKSIASILDNLDRTTAFIPGQLPQVAGLITDLRVTMKSAEDVLVALTNNPLLRGGVPQKPESQSGGTSPRNIRF